MTYAQKLRDPRWQKKRLQILERDKWACCICHSTTRNLQVHHLFYARLEPWQYPDHAYQTLCEQCHKERQDEVDGMVDELRVCLGDVATAKLHLVLRECVDVARKNAIAPFVPVSPEKAKTLFDQMREALNEPPQDQDEQARIAKNKALFKAMREAASE